MGTLWRDSRSVPPEQRSSFWRDAVRDVFQVESETMPLGEVALETALERHDIGNLSVVVLRGSSQQLTMRDWGRAGTVQLLLPQTPAGFIEADGVRQELQPGDAYLLNARGPVLIQTPNRFEHLALLFPLASSELARAFIGRREAGSLQLSGAAAATLAGTLPSLQANAPGIATAAAPMVARSMVELFHAALVETLGAQDESRRSDKSAKRSAKRLEAYHRLRIRQHAQAGLGDPDLSVESIATAVGLSTRRVHQLFAASEMTLMRWIWSERLAQCHARLGEAPGKGVRIGEVAYEWGFSDPAHFSRAFKQRYGASPSQHIQHIQRQRANTVT